MLSGNTPSPPTNAHDYKQAEILQIVVSNALAPISMERLMRVRTRTFKPSPKPRLPIFGNAGDGFFRLTASAPTAKLHHQRRKVR
jgi:hypothetical protein